MEKHRDNWDDSNKSHKSIEPEMRVMELAQEVLMIRDLEKQ
jgi:hypothetical protein